MSKVIILGSGAAPGVPSIACGWGVCDPNNPKNRRRRTTIYLELDGTKMLIDTSPDLHDQLIDSRVSYLDAVLYTHSHADHLHGIDDLRDINRLLGKSLNIYANAHASETIRQRFSYVLADPENPNNPVFRASLVLNEVQHGKSFYVAKTKVTPIDLEGHAVPSTGYVLNDGEVVYISDCRIIPERSLQLIPHKPRLLIIPLTTIVSQSYHLGLENLLEYVRVIQPEQAVINHMAVECDYENVNRLTPDNVMPAYDGMTIEL